MQVLSKNKLEIIQSEIKPKVNLNTEILEKIQFLCANVSAVEWSGILLYTVEKGSIKDATTLEIRVKDIILMDIGSTATTEFNFVEKKRDGSGFIDRHMDYCNKNMDAFYWKMGLIHSHHNMRVFFSTTDMEELNDNVGNYNYYLSLIVNNKFEMVAKIATLITEKGRKGVNVTALDDEGIPYETVLGDTPDINKMLVYDCEIIKEKELKISEDFFNNYLDVLNHKIQKEELRKKELEINKSVGNFAQTKVWTPPSFPKIHFPELAEDEYGNDDDDDDANVGAFLSEEIVEKLACYVLTNDNVNETTTIDSVLSNFNTGSIPNIIKNITTNIEIYFKTVEKTSDEEVNEILDTALAELFGLFEELEIVYPFLAPITTELEILVYGDPTEELD